MAENSHVKRAQSKLVEKLIKTILQDIIKVPALLNFLTTRSIRVEVQARALQQTPCRRSRT
jgi:hypothetical protein